MRRVLLFVCLCFCLQGISQNAYYDVLELVQWHKLPNSSQGKREKSTEILIKLLKYSQGKTRQFFSQDYKDIGAIFKNAEEIYIQDTLRKIPIEVFLQVIDTTTQSLPNDLEVQRDILKSLKQFRSKLDESLYKLDYAAIQLTQNKIDYPSFYDSVKVFFELVQSRNDLLTGSQVDTTPLTSIITLDSLKDEDETIRNRTIEKIKDAEKVLRLLVNDQKANLIRADTLARNSIIDKTRSLNIDIQKKLFPNIAVRGINIADKIEDETLLREAADRKYLGLYPQAASQLQNDAVAPRQEVQQLSDLNFPTQTEIIDAIAVYLARRTKEEAALFMIESLNRILKSDDLARDLFPQTVQLMQTQEAYTSPRFGAKWRHAIATDYISLPENIKKSQFIASRFSNTANKQYFDDAVTFASYVAKRYNFVDIIRTLYADPTKLNGKVTSVGASLLHIINQEFFDKKENSNNYWISPQAFFRLDTTHLKCLYDLVRMKYRNTVSSKARSIFEDPQGVKGQIVDVGRSFTELFTILHQFYTAQQSSAANSDGKTIKQDVFWDTQRNLVDFVLTQPLFKITPKERNALELVQKGFIVYDYISNKNYIAAADNVLAIINTLTNGAPRQIINLANKEIVKYKAQALKVYEQIDSSNKTLQTIQLLNAVLDSVNARIGGGASNNIVIDRKFIEDRFDLFDFQDASINNLFSGTAARLESHQLAIQNAINSYAARLLQSYEKMKNEYDSLSDSVKKNLGDLKTGKFSYNRVKALTNNLEELGYSFSLENTSYFKWLTSFSELLTEIASAKDNESLANIIEAHALPTGSYRIKRNSIFSIDLNAYVGVFAGREKMKLPKNLDEINDARDVYGVTAPIGLSFTLGHTVNSSKNEEGQGKYLNKRGKVKRYTQHSWTLDLTFVDVGAVLSYRFSDQGDSTAGLPKEVKWSQILSLGANLRYGLKGTPFCFGIGVQQTPELRTINDSQKTAWRVHLTAAFDLPLFNFYRKRY